MLKSSDAFGKYQFQKKWLSKIKNAVILIYYFVVPFVQAPAWCISAYKKHDDSALVYQCKNEQGGTILYSNMIKFNPWFTGFFDSFSIGFLVFYTWYKTTWRTVTTNGKIRFWSLLVIFCICTTNIIICAYRDTFAYINNFVRPIVVLIFF